MSHIIMPPSPRGILMGRVIQALLGSAELQSVGAVLLRNPRTPASLAEAGPLVLVIKDSPDSLSGREGGRQVREATFVLAAIARLNSDTGSQDADDHADRLHHAAARAIAGAQKSYSDPSGDPPVRLKAMVKETAAMFEVKGLEVDGALVASTWSISYQTS